jgi:hypothetical protein
MVPAGLAPYDGATEQEAAMKLSIEIDCTPEEARAFFGLPDVTGVNDFVVEEMRKRVESNLSLLSPEEMFKNFATFGAGAQEQFRKLLSVASDMTKSAGKPKSDGA